MRPNSAIETTRNRPMPSHGVIVGSKARHPVRAFLAGRREATGAVSAEPAAGSLTVLRLVMISLLSGPGPDAGVDEAVQQVDHEVGGQHGERDEQEHALH